MCIEESPMVVPSDRKTIGNRGHENNAHFVLWLVNDNPVQRFFFLRCADDGVTHARNTFPKFHPGVLGNVSVPFAHHPLGIGTVPLFSPTAQEKSPRRAISRKRDCCRTCSKSVAGK